MAQAGERDRKVRDEVCFFGGGKRSVPLVEERSSQVKIHQASSLRKGLCVDLPVMLGFEQSLFRAARQGKHIMIITGYYCLVLMY
jgi:hypothetical protein